MRSSNPVFARSDTFNGRGSSTSGAGLGSPSTWSVGSPSTRSGGPGVPGSRGPVAPTEVGGGRITIDTVVQKTAFTLGLLVVAAAVTWFYIGDLSDMSDAELESAAGTAGGLAIGGALIGFALAMVNSFKRVISPALVLAYAVAQGVFIGATSVFFEAMYPGIVLQAVLGTLCAFAGTLTAYKVLDIKVTPKFRRGVVAALFGFVALSLLDLVLSAFGLSFGFNGFGTFGLITSIAGVVLGVLMLILDFDFVEQAVAVGAPERESWRAAFGLTVTIVWLYIEILRILAILRGSD